MQKGRSSKVQLEIYKTVSLEVKNVIILSLTNLSLTEKEGLGFVFRRPECVHPAHLAISIIGVRALSSFPKGTFVGLYSGEVIPEEETDARGEIYNAIERT